MNTEQMRGGARLKSTCHGMEAGNRCCPSSSVQKIAMETAQVLPGIFFWTKVVFGHGTFVLREEWQLWAWVAQGWQEAISVWIPSELTFSTLSRCSTWSGSREPWHAVMRYLWPLVLPWFLVAARSHFRSSNSSSVSHSSWEMPSLAPVWFQEQGDERWCQPHAQGLHQCWESPHGTLSPPGNCGGFVSHDWNSLPLPLHISMHSGWKWFQTFGSSSCF